MISEEYTNLYGTWKVSTEGDCEGRTSTSLGIYTGWMDEIALSLADKCFYSLNMKKIEPKNRIGPPTRSSVNVTLDIDSKTWDMAPQERAAAVQELIKNVGRNSLCEIKPGGAYASVLVVSKTFDPVDHEKQKALEKLTPREKELLGLK